MDSLETAGGETASHTDPGFPPGTMAKSQFPLEFWAVSPFIITRVSLALTCSQAFVPPTPWEGSPLCRHTDGLECDLQLPSFKGKDRKMVVLVQPIPGLRHLERYWVPSSRAKACFNLCARDCLCEPEVCLRRNPLST